MSVSLIGRVGLAMGLAAGIAAAENCANLPTSFTGHEFPTGDFFSNFNNSCYTISFATGHGVNLYGDLNAQYYTMYYKVDPRYQLILVSSFPNARYYSVTLYDNHNALSQSILDTNIVPLTPKYVNPFQPGVPYVSGQQYALPISFGGTPGTIETGCTMNGYNVQQNNLDGTIRHAGMDWNSDAGFFQQYPNFGIHDVDTARHQNPNPAGVVMIRAYVDATPLGYDTNPHIIVRDVASGCAYPAAYAQNTLGIVTNVGDAGRQWMDQQQVTDHQIYDQKYLPQLCYGAGPVPNQLLWTRVEQFVPWTNPDAAYISAAVPKGLPQTLAAAGEVLRIRVRIPQTPPTPCANGCARTGNEQMRYMSLSFRNPDGSVFATLMDSQFTTDQNGYATLIVGTGAKIPAWITPQNGYTYLDLTASTNYQDLGQITMRHIIPSAGFQCGGNMVPYRVSVSTPLGGLLSDYQPVADYPLAALLPPVALPSIGPATCGLFPAGDPGIRGACGVFPSLQPPAIDMVVTECHVPECSYFVAQPNPPITIVGSGFGTFTAGLPFAGTTNVVRITDLTQGWIAGYPGAPCDVSINSWSTGRIQLSANFNKHGACPVNGGDQMLVEIWNPQTMFEGQYSMTAVNPLDHTPTHFNFGKP